MKKEIKVLPEVVTSKQTQAAEPERRTMSGASREAVRRTGEVAPVVVDAPHQSVSALQGTPSCNTVPSNDKTKQFNALLLGIDSLYLSYYGLLAEDWDLKLSDLKEIAQSEDESLQALAQVCIGSHLFEVRDKGMPRFPYVLADNCFFVKLSRSKSNKLPMAHVQISSEYLAAVGVEAAEKDLRFVVSTLGLVPDAATISRADLFLDFTCIDDLAAIHQPDWVTRANLMAKYFDCRLEDPFTGWTIGMGGNLHARLYEKAVEIKTKSHKTWLFDLWQANGWQSGDKVWRMEFQTEKALLKQLGIISLPDLLNHQAALWRYLTQDWLRLTCPSLTDSKRDRWPNHPLWDDIANVYLFPTDQPRLKRFTVQRLPHDERIFVHGLGGLTSFMAREGIEDFGEGMGEYLHQVNKYHAQNSEGFQGYVQRKVKAKARKYNTINNREHLPETIQERQQQAKAYCRAKEGE